MINHVLQGVGNDKIKTGLQPNSLFDYIKPGGQVKGGVNQD